MSNINPITFLFNLPENCLKQTAGQDFFHPALTTTFDKEPLSLTRLAN